MRKLDFYLIIMSKPKEDQHMNRFILKRSAMDEEELKKIEEIL